MGLEEKSLFIVWRIQHGDLIQNRNVQYCSEDCLSCKQVFLLFGLQECQPGRCQNSIPLHLNTLSQMTDQGPKGLRRHLK